MPGTYDLTTVAVVKTFLGITVVTYDALLDALITRVSDEIERYCGRKFVVRAYTQERHHGDGTKELYTHEWPIVSVARVATSTAGAWQIRSTSADCYSATCEVTRSEADPRTITGVILRTWEGANDGTTTLTVAANHHISDMVTAANLLAGWSTSALGNYGRWDAAELIACGAKECRLAATTLEVPDTRLSGYEIHQEDGCLKYTPGFRNAWRNIYVDYSAGYTTIPGGLEQLAIEIIQEIFNSRTINTALRSEKIGDYAYTVAMGAFGGDILSAISRRQADFAPWRRMTIRP